MTRWASDAKSTSSHEALTCSKSYYLSRSIPSSNSRTTSALGNFQTAKKSKPARWLVPGSMAPEPTSSAPVSSTPCIEEPTCRTYAPRSSELSSSHATKSTLAWSTLAHILRCEPQNCDEFRSVASSIRHANRHQRVHQPRRCRAGSRRPRRGHGRGLPARRVVHAILRPRGHGVEHQRGGGPDRRAPLRPTHVAGHGRRVARSGR